jgi:hypothetical protein
MANKKLICHEMPRELEARYGYDLNDYEYFLLHKAMADPEYCRRAVKSSLYSQKFIILDNSCYELGASLDNDVLYHYYKLIQPTALIYPDVLGNMTDTLTRSHAFKEAFPDTWGTSMLVAQGSSRMELISCYEEIVESEWSKDCFMIGIPFVFSWIDKDPTKQADERIALLREMDVLGIIRKDKKHHLLGTWQAREFAEYRDYDWIYSVDTSNPIMAALEGTKYTETGLVEKPKANFDSTYDTKLVDIDIDLVYYNVMTFRRIVNG